MVPRVTSKGRSFKGAGAYFLHDLGKASTSERVAFTHTVNMLTDDPEKALKVMAWTAEHAQELKAASGQKNTGRKAENPVYNYCLAWAPDQDPAQEDMIVLGLRSMAVLGVGHHEAVFVAHNDTPHKHLHIILNRVDPETGLMAKMSHDRNLLSRLAQAYEEETGRVYCAQRVENNRRRDLGERSVKADPSVRLTETSGYLAHRQARIEAQRQAAALEAARLAKERALHTSDRDLRAAFDTAAGVSDWQYRAKDTERPPGEERAMALAAWRDEQGQEKERRQHEREQAQRALQEQRRQALDARRAEEWTRYAGRQWQALDDKQGERREGLRALQEQGLHRCNARLNRKYAESEMLFERHIQEARDALHHHGIRAVLDKMTGAGEVKESRLAELQEAAGSLTRQKEAERAAYEAKQRAQRDAQARKQEEERRVLAQRLAATKARQDAKFEEQERARAERLQKPRDLGGDLASAWAKAARDQVQAVVNERAARAEAAEMEWPGRKRRDWDAGYS